MISLSSNAFSVDDQIADVIRHLCNGNEAEQANYRDLIKVYPEYDFLVWEGSHVDAKASGVDIEFMSWVSEWLDTNTSVLWLDGEPVILEEGDSLEDDEHEQDSYYSGTGEMIGDDSYMNYLNHI